MDLNSQIFVSVAVTVECVHWCLWYGPRLSKEFAMEEKIRRLLYMEEEKPIDCILDGDQQVEGSLKGMIVPERG